MNLAKAETLQLRNTLEQTLDYAGALLNVSVETQ